MLFVIPIENNTKLPAAEPRPGPIGQSCVLAQLVYSYTAIIYGANPLLIIISNSKANLFSYILVSSSLLLLKYLYNPFHANNLKYCSGVKSVSYTHLTLPTT